MHNTQKITMVMWLQKKGEKIIFGVINFNSFSLAPSHDYNVVVDQFNNRKKDGEPPVVDYCPLSQKHKIEKHHESIKVSWIEPKFSDNVKVTDVTQTNVSENKIKKSPSLRFFGSNKQKLCAPLRELSYP